MTKRWLGLAAGIGFAGCAPLALSAADSGLKTLPDHIPPVAAQLSASGTLPATNRLRLAIGLPLRDAPGLDVFLAQIADPSSPQYHRYLTPAEFTERFGPTAQDYQRVLAFATQSGFAITATNGNRLLLDVEGAVGDIQKAFHVTLNTYHHPTENRDFFAPDAGPSVPASLPVADVSGLSSYGLPHPKVVRQHSVTAAPMATGSGSSGAYLGYDFRAAYLPGVTLTGAGQLVGLVQFDGFYSNDITSYETAAGLPAVPLQTVLLDGFSGTPTTGPDSANIEVSLDIEMAASMAPGLSKIVVFEGNPNTGYFFPNHVLSAMADSNSISQLSCSWGWSGGPTNTTDTLFKKMAAQGQSFFVASGDSDAFTVGAASTNGVDNPSLYGAPASSPYITTVGGTTLTTTGPGGAWAAETVWNWGLHDGSYAGSSGGISSYYAIPSWQAGVNMAANGGSTVCRNLPDVALTADNIQVNYGNGSEETIGGTSCATPLWAGVAALVNQQSVTAGRAVVGFVNPAIYSLGKGTNYGGTFHDIVTGNNVWPDSPDGYYAVAGYDLCTGWGTPSGQNLITALAGTPEPLGILPSSGFVAGGVAGGPFAANATTFALTNYSSAALSWSLINTSSWLQVSATSGTLSAGASAGVTASLTAAADSLAAGAYAASLEFTNGISHIAQFIPFTLTVVSSLVANGGFETGDFTGWTLTGNTVVARGPFGPTIYNAVESSSAYSAVVHSGTYGAFMGDNQLATLAQTLATIPGENYRLSFWLDNVTSGSGQEFLASWGGTTLYQAGSPGAFSWTNLQFVVTATNASTVLQFAAQNTPAYFGLDDVSVTPIPALVFKTARPEAGTFNLTWAVSTGLVYQVQYKTNLAQPGWLSLTAAITATNRTLTAADSSAASQRYYRLVVAP